MMGGVVALVAGLIAAFVVVRELGRTWRGHNDLAGMAPAALFASVALLCLTYALGALYPL